ncbi:patatin-like phospholipase family protein [Flavihumibacter stibioxidans]|uniref:PNPLA domain-containing protein n=1 Tax=Flavihumibacter stibioxidans TaxID=1834163 RepID=A0ABR7M4E5_9BACT|nr:patatin-like phospholipase family protein [Flavihumibacter stibioxidans]MBC6489875.1 hypothetical protein [Flavihumibacter stibioxidans]
MQGNKKKVQLVLGSGGARGIAHIGVIDVLEEEGYEIVSVAGCSMGAVVGGIYAAGFHREYKEWMLGLTKGKVWGLLDFTLDKKGFVKGDRLFEVLGQFMDVPDIEAFRIPFTAIAADMYHKREKWFRSGRLTDALRASIAIPGVFTPVIDEDQILVDGGVLNPLPLNAVERQPDAIVLAVNLNGHAPFFVPAPKKETEESTILKEVKALLRINSSREKPAKEIKISNARELAGSKYLNDILLYSYQMTQDRVTAMMLKEFPPDVLVEISREACSTFEFYRSAEMVEIGRIACRKALDGVTARQ